MHLSHFYLFETSLGNCGIAWRGADSSRGIAVTAFQLPEATHGATRSRIAGKCGGLESLTPPKEIATIIQSVCRHLSGDVQDFLDIPLDLAESGPFDRAVYNAARKIPPGQTRTYGQLAQSIGRPAAARPVGQALGRNPIALIVPCHRILAAGGKPGGFTAHGGRNTKARLLEIEGFVSTPENNSLFIKKVKMQRAH